MDNLDNPTELQQDELATLKTRADTLGLKYHPSIGVDALREKVNAKLNESLPSTAQPAAAAVPAAQPGTTGEETEGQRRNRLKKESSALVRIRIQCMNPLKKEWNGEIFTVGNSVVGSFRKFVPFNAEEGYHVPKIMLEHLQSRQCQTFVNAKTKNGVTVRQSKLIKEFAIEILDPLTQDELNELARRQAMAGSIG